MSKRIAAALTTALLFASGCVKEISSDERLERETAKSDALGTSTAEDLLKLKCDDVTAALTKARDESAQEEKRLNTYGDLLEKVKDRNHRFDEALSRNPDLAYQEGSGNIIAARDGCVDASAEVRRDYETLVREIVQVPVVDDYKDGKPVKAARLSFDLLRDAIEKLELDDKDALTNKLNNAEKTVEVKETKRKRDK